MRSLTGSTRRVVAGGAAATLLVGLVGVLPAHADVAGTGVVLNEAFLSGGSSGAAFNRKFVELYNPGGSPVDLGGWSLQYRSATGTGPANGVTLLTGTIPAHGYFLVAGGSNGTTGADLPTPDVSGTLNPSGTTGTLVLARTTTALTLPAGSVTGDARVADLLGYGTSNTFETAVATAPAGNTNAPSINRTAGKDTDDNAADFSLQTTITPTSSAGAPTDPPDPTDPPAPAAVSIAQLQGTGDASPYVGTSVTTQGVVTAVYPSGGFAGYYLQTPGTGGGVDLADHHASDAVFVFGDTDGIEIGAHLEVTGAVSEYFGLTELTPAAGGVRAVTGDVAPVTPATVPFPATDAARETLEGMLVAPQGPFTVSDVFPTNQYGEIVLAAGTAPLRVPTDVAAPGSAAAADVRTDNAARRVVLDDGASINFLSTANGGASMDIEVPYLSTTAPVRTGAAVTFTRPVILDYRNSAWKLQPTTRLTRSNAGSVQPATFANTRTAAPEDVGGDLTLATFNVLNYFTTTGDTVAGCAFYVDRDGNPLTVRSGCDARGAADAANLARQQAKIVAALTALDADVVSVEEIENSAVFGKDRDAALATLVDALNAADGAGTWAFVASPDDLPTGEDVIRTAFIYHPAAVAPVGPSRILIDSPAFANAREPLAQAFRPVGGTAASTFLVIANHFKSKGATGATGADADTGDGQGAFTASRVAQAHALVDFASSVAASVGTDAVFLTGDFNSYSHEDPVAVLTAAGFVDQGARTGESTYVFGGEVGSLDHVFASSAGDALVTGADVWNINAGESVGLEYSRYNTNAVNLYDASPYRSSDHDPVVVGLDLPAPSATVDVNLLNINDFHGRIDANTVKFAGTVENLRKEGGEGNTLFLSAGDNIGASLFASAVAQDQPTIDVLNALDLRASAVGNHEFDRGFADLVDRVVGPAGDRNADFAYLGANVYTAGTTTPALPEYALLDVDGLTVGVIGAVTQETPSLVTPAGIAGLTFGDPVAAVNRVAARLSDGDPANGEADVLVAEYHEGAGFGTPDGATLEQEVAAGGAFASIVNNTSAAVDAIFTGHTHKQYAWDAPVPGVAGATRPILQTGSYGEFVGQVVLHVDRASHAVTSYTARNVARTTTPDADLVAAYPRVAAVKGIVDAALAAAAQVGNTVVGSASADITTAYTGGSYVNGVYVGPGPTPTTGRDDRSSESALGDLVADALVASLSSAERGGAEIGVVNPGGLRAELFAGEITYAEANAVLPFVNNLGTTSLTGTQLKTMLEQQWQTLPDGTVPSRAYLQLGLSKNVTYTFDPAAPQGSHITSVWVNGEPLDPARSYRVGTFSFLLSGGDNFRVFTQGANTKDSGLIDRDAWIAYITANSPLAPDFARQAVAVTGAGQTVDPGAELVVDVSRLDLTSLGSPRNTTLGVAWQGSTATFPDVPVTDGAASVRVTVPADAPADSVLVLTAHPSGTTVRVPVTVHVTPPVELDPSRTRLLVVPGTVWQGHRALAVAHVRTADGAAHGTVTFTVDGTVLATRTLVAGTALVWTARDLAVGPHTVTVTYSGDATTAPSSDDARLLVRAKAKGRAWFVTPSWMAAR